ncbi:hypothetical protein FHS67_006223 [Aminobacter aminovorans]|uniref:TniQ n=1 Tax=Aminobacter aminovorans TaxID=83263 RepID=A0ABR6HH32_AMIAI|nr:hypothetical protein [Aminobacter aminovorans]
MFFFDTVSRKGRPPLLGVGRLGPEVYAYYALDLKERLQTDIPPTWKQPIERDALELLTKLSYGKCPFCERAGVGLQPYRFRPPAYASPMQRPEDKECYLWLAHRWDNFFPICEECLPQDKAFFPVDGPRAKGPTISSQLMSGPALELDERRCSIIRARYSARPLPFT